MKLLKLDWLTGKRIFSFIAHKKWLYAVSLFISASSGFLQTLLLSLLTGQLLEKAQSGDWQSVVSSFLFYALLFMGALLLFAIFDTILLNLAQKGAGQLRKSMYNKLLFSGIAAHQHSAAYLSRLDDDAAYASGLLGDGMKEWLSLFFSLIFGIITVFSVAWQSGVALLGLGVVMFLVNTLYVSPNRKRFDARQKNMASTVTDMSDLLAGAEVLRFYPYSGLLGRFKASCTLLYKQSMGAFRMRTLQNTLGQVQAALTLAAGVGIGFFLYQQGIIGLAMIPVLWGVSESIVRPFSSIGHYLASIQENLAGAKRVCVVLDLPAEESGPLDSFLNDPVFLRTKNLRIPLGEVKTIAYPDMALAGGKRYGLSGPSGSGKTTLLRALMGLIPYDGSLKLFGQEVRDIDLLVLRAQTAYLPQNCLLFHGTIEENLTAAMPDAEKRRIERAAKLAGALPFILAQPEGWQTQVGERGGALSGGQRQRICIARAFLKDAPVLLMDEPTSALDEGTAGEVIDSIAKLMYGRTALVVTHSAEIAAFMDETVELK